MNPAPLLVPLRPSPGIAALLAIGHLLAVFALALGLDGFPFVLASAGVGLSAYFTVAAALLRSSDSAVEIELRAEGRAAWRDRDGDWHEAALERGGFVSPWLILIPLAATGARLKWIVVPPDAASADDRRRLRVWLRWRRDRTIPTGE